MPFGRYLKVEVKLFKSKIKIAIMNTELSRTLTEANT